MSQRFALGLVRGAHTIIYVVMASSILALLYAGLTGVQGRWLWVALGLTMIEVVVFVANGWRCPMTGWATRRGAAPGDDTFFPSALTRHTLHVFGPLLAIGLVLLALRWSGVLH